MSEFQYKRLPVQACFPSIKKEWDELNRSEFGEHPLLSSDFVELLIESFSDGHEILNLAYQNDKLRFSTITRKKGIFFEETFLPSQAQIAPCLIPFDISPQNVLKTRNALTIMTDYLCQDPCFSGATSWKDSSSQSLSHATTMNIDLAGSFDNYWMNRPAKLRQNVKRYLRRIYNSFGSVDFRIILSPEGIPAAVQRYSNLEQQGWKGKKGTAISGGSNQLSFYTKVLDRFSRSNNAAVYELFVDGQLIASRMSISNNKQVVMLKTTYDESFSKHAPGRVLLYLTLKYLFDETDKQLVEFYTDATDDQKKWATDLREIQHIIAYKNSYYKKIYNQAKKIKQAIKNISYSSDFDDKCKSDSVIKPSWSDMSTISGNDFFSTPEWFSVLKETAINNGDKVFAVKVDCNDDGQVVFPLLSKMSKPRQIEALTTFYSPTFLPISSTTCISAQACKKFVLHLVNQRPKWQSINLSMLPAESGLLKNLYESFREKGWWTQKYYCTTNWYLPCDGMSYKEYIETRPSKLKNIITRKSRKFSSHSGGKFTIYTPNSIGSADEGLNAFQMVYARSWKKPEPYPLFIPRLIETCIRMKSLRLGICWIDDKPIAAQLWIVNNGVASIYKLAYDNDYQKFSAGTLLSAKMFEYVLENDKVSKVDFLGGNDTYKKDWMTHRKNYWGLVAFNPKTITGMVLGSVNILGHHVKKVSGMNSKQFSD